MRKFLCAALLLVSVCSLSYGQSVDQLFDEFGNENNAECVRISPFVMSIGKAFIRGEGEEGVEVVRKVRSMKVMDLEDCQADVKERFMQKVNKLNLAGYEELVRVNDKGEKVYILMKIKKEAIREFLIVCSGGDDCALIQINGKFSKDDIDNLVKQGTTTKNG